MPPVTLTAVVEGKDLDPAAFAREIRAVLELEADEIDKLYRQFYGKWGENRTTPRHSKRGARPIDTAKPVMSKEVKVTGKDAYAEVSTRGNEEHPGNKKLLWLDEGTKIQWAQMGRGWRSKTAVGQIRSGSGAGRVAYYGKGQFARRGRTSPNPGIEAREVSEAIKRVREPRFQKNVDDAVERAAT